MGHFLQQCIGFADSGAQVAAASRGSATTAISKLTETSLRQNRIVNLYT
jgi:hypothetical protein